MATLPSIHISVVTDWFTMVSTLLKQASLQKQASKEWGPPTPGIGHTQRGPLYTTL